MITQVVFYRCKEGQRDNFLNEVKSIGIDQKCKVEGGNIRYSFFASLENDDTLLLVESWTDTHSLECHYKSDNFMMLGALKKKYVEQTVIEKYFKEE
jgi:quinol monooxygenase YgiN